MPQKKFTEGNRTEEKKGIGLKVRKALWLFSRTGLRGFIFLLRAFLRYSKANFRRYRLENKLGLSIPTVLVISATMRCNYECHSCYSRGRSVNNEMDTAVLDELLTEAEKLGVLTVLFTGGEPFLREDLPVLLARHHQLLFIIITNGSQVTPELASQIAKNGNAIILVSIEGFTGDTDARRGVGTHLVAMQAMEHLHSAGVLFGFSVTNHTLNSDCLSSDRFIDDMISQGCIAGLFSEYVPCGPVSQREWILDNNQRTAFHQKIEKLRVSKPIALVQFPQDEYGEKNRCSGAGQSSLHINSQGDVEPCPFVPLSVENIRQGG